MHCTFRLGLFLLALTLSETGLAQELSWREAAGKDLAAIRDIIARDHPAMAPSLDDADFQALEQRSFATASDIASRVTDESGYRAALKAYTVGLGDKHIKVRFHGRRDRLRWPGFLTERQAGRFVVGYSEISEVDVGDVLESCDGQAADDIAEAKLGRFHANWRIEAQRIAKAPYLFIDVGNPFVEPWLLCTFMRQGEAVDIRLTWTSISDSASFKDYTRSLDASSTFDARPMDRGGYWIRLPRLNGQGRELVDGLDAHREELLQAPFVIVDVRGNSGGNSEIGSDLARILGLQPKPPRLLRGRPSVHWRASPSNAETLRAFAKNSDTLRTDQQRAFWRDQAEQIAETVARRGDFSPPLPKVRPVLETNDTPSVSTADARVFLLTDHACFSSCLMMADEFRRAGAAHIGIETDAATRYMDVGESLAPSGRVSVQTVRKVALHRPYWRGPYTPVAVFQGDSRDDRAVEAWVMSLVDGR